MTLSGAHSQRHPQAQSVDCRVLRNHSAGTVIFSGFYYSIAEYPSQLIIQLKTKWIPIRLCLRIECHHSVKHTNTYKVHIHALMCRWHPHKCVAFTSIANFHRQTPSSLFRPSKTRVCHRIVFFWLHLSTKSHDGLELVWMLASRISLNLTSFFFSVFPSFHLCFLYAFCQIFCFQFAYPTCGSRHRDDPLNASLARLSTSACSPYVHLHSTQILKFIPYCPQLIACNLQPICNQFYSSILKTFPNKHCPDRYTLSCL